MASKAFLVIWLAGVVAALAAMVVRETFGGGPRK